MTALLRALGLAMPGRLEPTPLEISAGQLIALVGPNGSGKTSLLHALAGIPPSTGDVWIGGIDPGTLHPDARQRLLTFLPASRHVVWPVTARNFIDLALPPGGDWAMLSERLELAPLLDRRMDELSTGERTRVMIARALAPDPELLLLDEPIANLDPYWQLAVLDELTARARGDSKTVIAAIHDLPTALAWSDRLLVMDGRHCVADTLPGDLLASGLIEQIFEVTLEVPRMTMMRGDPQSSP